MPTTDVIRQSILSFLSDMLDKKLIEKNREIDALIKKGASINDQRIIDNKAKINDIKRHYSYDNWLYVASTKMVSEVTLATHISKGINSMSRGDSLLFTNSDDIPDYLVGSHSISSGVLDVSGNAAALPVYNFINLAIGEDTTVRELIESNNPEFIKALSEDTLIANKLFAAFKGLFAPSLAKPITSPQNKQVLFPLNGDDLDISNPDRLDYINIVPLYPSVFCHEVRGIINNIRFSESNKIPVNDALALNETEDNQHFYHRLPNLALLKLGGSKPANISKVVVMSNGETLLLPALPPTNVMPKPFSLPIESLSLFTTLELNDRTNHSFSMFIATYVRHSSHPNFKNKMRRNEALHLLIISIFEVAIELRARPAGWLDNHNLDISERYWLDARYIPNSADGVEIAYAQAERKPAIVSSVANYINHELSKRLPKRFLADVGSSTYKEWRREVTKVAANYKLEGVEVLV